MKRLLVAGLAGFAILPARAASPNFLFLITDVQRRDALGVVQREQDLRARFFPGASFDIH